MKIGLETFSLIFNYLRIQPYILKINLHSVKPINKELDAPSKKIRPFLGFVAQIGYDGNNTYEFLETQNIKPTIPPPKNAKKATEKHRSDTINYIKEKGYYAWYNKNEYGRREIVENTIYRYKSIIGAKLRSRNWDNQDAELQSYLLKARTAIETIETGALLQIKKKKWLG